MDENITKIIIALIGLLAACAITLKLVFRSKKKTTKIVQKNNTVHGDLAGRDVNKE